METKLLFPEYQKESFRKHFQNWLDEITENKKYSDAYKKYLFDRFFKQLNDDEYLIQQVNRISCKHDWVCNHRSDYDNRERRICPKCEQKQVRGTGSDSENWYDSHFAVLHTSPKYLIEKWRKLSKEEIELYAKQFEVKEKLAALAV